MNPTNFVCRSILAGCLILSCSAVHAEPVTGEGSDTGHIVVPAIPGISKMFLPDIGIAGDFAYERHNLEKTDPRYVSEQPRIRDGQLVFFEPIDPYTNAQFTLDLPEDGVANIAEAWVYFNKLPGNTSVRVGRFNPRFGLFNIQNTFQLPMVDRPHAISAYLSPDGMTSSGLEFNTYVPNPWDLNLKLNTNIVRGDALNAAADNTDLSYVATLDYSQDLFTSGGLEAGVSVAQGPSPLGLSETLEEPYIQFQYAPTQGRSGPGAPKGCWPSAGIRDRTIIKTAPTPSWITTLICAITSAFCSIWPTPPWRRTENSSGLGPNATWFLSDNMRMRCQYTHTTPLGSERPEEKITLQATFSLGNLKQMD